MDFNSQPYREGTVKELESIFRVYGNPLPKSSAEIESQLYDKSRNKEEYSVLAQRLLRHLREMAKRRRVPGSASAPVIYRDESNVFPVESKSATLPAAPSVTTEDKREACVSVFSPEVFPVPAAPESYRFPPVAAAPPVADVYKFPSVAVTQAAVLREVCYGSVRLPAPNKRTFVSATNGNYRTSPSDQRVEPMSRSDDDAPEIITRLVRDNDAERGEESTGSRPELNYETYEVSFKFLVPLNAVIKQITIHLKKTLETNLI